MSDFPEWHFGNLAAKVRCVQQDPAFMGRHRKSWGVYAGGHRRNIAGGCGCARGSCAGREEERTANSCCATKLESMIAGGGIGFGGAEFGAVGGGRADLDEFGVVVASGSGVSGGARGFGGSEERVETVRRVFQSGFIFGEGVGGAVKIEEHVGEHFASGNGEGFVALLVLAVGGGAKFV